MQLKLAKKKEINEDVLRMIIQYGLGFASRVKNLENKEIEDWKEDKLYEKGAKILYNNYLWVAKVTNQSSAWNESYWEKVGDDLELIDLDTIKTMLGLTTDELQTLSSIILDSQVRLDKTYSSSKIYSDLQQCLNDSKAFTLQEFAKASKASYHVVSATSEMTDKSVIYLMPNSTNYDMYIVESDGTPTKIGDTTIDLSQFYTKTEIDNDFVKKTDADGKYALITTVDGKVDKTSILSTISSNPSDDKLLSEKAINDTFAKKTDITTTIDSSSTDSEVPSAKSVKTELDKKVDKTSITTTIDYSSTDNQVPSAKSIYYNCIEGIELNQTVIDTYGTEILKYPLGIWRICGDDFASKFTDLPVKISGRIEITSIEPYTNKNPLTSSWSYRVYNFETYIGENYIRKITSYGTAGVFAEDSGWKKICTTSVKDVGVKNIVPSDTTTFINFKGNSSCNYYVKNGVCYVSLWGVKIASTGKTIKPGVILPKCANNRAGVLMTGTGDAIAHAFAFIIDNGELCFDVKDANIELYGSFSYPVENS